MRKQREHVKPVERRREKLKLPTFKGKGVKPGVNLDDSAALSDLIESDRDSARRASVGGVPRFRVHPSRCGFQTAVNIMKLNAVVDELEIDDATTETPSNSRR
jgi:hypothetical protein